MVFFLHLNVLHLVVFAVSENLGVGLGVFFVFF